MKFINILKYSLLCCFFCFGVTVVQSQTGNVPELVEVLEGYDRLSKEIILLTEEIKNLEASGNPVDPELRLRLQLYIEVNTALQANSIGLTTFNAVAGSSNYRGLKMDDEAYADLINGIWDGNMSELIRILSK